MSDEDHAILMEDSRPDGRNGRGEVEEEENKLKRKWSLAIMTENDKEEDEFDEMMTNGYPMQINFM